jgi:hypothetical protein
MHLAMYMQLILTRILNALTNHDREYLLLTHIPSNYS